MCRSEISLKKLQASSRKAEEEMPTLMANLEHARQRFTDTSADLAAICSEAQMLRVSLGCLPHSGMETRHRMLFECFSIKEPDAFDAGLLQPLEIIIGKRWPTLFCKRVSAIQSSCMCLESQ